MPKQDVDIMQKKEKIALLHSYDAINNKYEIGIDEAGRGPLFGRLYTAAVVLPKVGSFRYEDMKDSKKFHSKKKIQDVAKYIKDNAIAWSVQYIEASVIDDINIRQSVFRGMHECVREIMTKCQIIPNTDESITYTNEYMLLVDGNDFKPFTKYDDIKEEIFSIPHETFEQGDNKFCSIAAASILAKTSHDEYISNLCIEYPELVSRYSLDKNVGYGTKAHLLGIEEHGITQWHRKSFARCNAANYAPLREPYGSPNPSL
jgi:ribonuclease HII